MPRDSGDDAYEWMAARERAAIVVEAGTRWIRRNDGRQVTIVNGGFLPAYEAGDSRVRYRYVGNSRVNEMTIDRFMKSFEASRRGR